MKILKTALIAYVVIYAGLDIIENGYWFDKVVFGALVITLAITTLTKSK